MQKKYEKSKEKDNKSVMTLIRQQDRQFQTVISFFKNHQSDSRSCQQSKALTGCILNCASHQHCTAPHSTSRHCGLHQTISTILQSTFRTNSFFFKVFESASEITQKRLFYERLLVFEKKICDMLPRVLVLCFSVGLPTLRSFYFTKQRSCFHVSP